MTSQEEIFEDSIMETGVVSLSKTKTVEWIPTGDAVISRRKLKADGTLEPNAYEIYIDSQSCRELLKQNDEIQRTMDAVQRNCLTNPTNIHLDASRIVQVSLFNGRPKFGIHKLDQAGRITRCVGLNFTPVEYAELIKFFTQYPPPPEEPYTVRFAVTQYAWRWCQPGDGEFWHKDNIWYTNPKQCLQAAENKKPLGASKVQVESRQDFYAINSDFVDAAVAKLIVNNIDAQKTLEIMQSKLISNGADEISEIDVAVYGPRVREEITLMDIFKLCLKVMSLSEKPKPLAISTLMTAVLQRGNSLEALESLKHNTLHEDYVRLFEQLVI